MPDQIVESSVERIFQYGVLGVFVIIFGFVIGYLYREWTKERKELLKDFGEERKVWEGKVESLNLTMSALQKDHVSTVERLQQARIDDGKTGEKTRGDDAKNYQASLIDLTKGATAALANVSTSLDQTKDALIEAKDTMREIGDDIRRRS